ncbi:MAG: hypothetical protein V5A22_07220 [Salinivenus sp.]
MTDVLLLMLAAVVGVPLAAIAHELTHVAFLWPVAEEIRLNPTEQYVEADIHTEGWRGHWADLAGLSPVIVGTLVAVALLTVGHPIPPLTTTEGLLGWGVWVAYSITGGLSDYIPSVSREKATAPGAGVDDD